MLENKNFKNSFNVESKMKKNTLILIWLIDCNWMVQSNSMEKKYPLVQEQLDSHISKDVNFKPYLIWNEQFVKDQNFIKAKL